MMIEDIDSTRLSPVTLFSIVLGRETQEALIRTDAAKLPSAGPRAPLLSADALATELGAALAPAAQQADAEALRAEAAALQADAASARQGSAF